MRRRGGGCDSWGHGQLTRENHRYGFHMPKTNARDKFYTKLEQERAAEKAA